MDELKKRIGFQNAGVQIQTLWRLGKEIEKKRPQGTRLDANTSEIPEISLLLDTLCGVDEAVAQVASQVLLQLVEKDALDFTFALNSSLNYVPSAKTLPGVVKAVYGLLTLQALAMQAKENKYRCPYALRSPPHPLISVITNRPESWPIISEEAVTLFTHPERRIRLISVEFMKPYIAFVLAEPQQSDQYAGARSGLERCLPIACRHGDDGQAEEILTLLLQLLPKMQMEKKANLASASRLVESMASLIREKCTNGSLRSDKQDHDLSTRRWQKLAGELFSLGLEIVLLCLRLGVVFCGVVAELIKLAPFGIEDSVDSNLLVLSTIIDSSHVFTYSQLVTLAQISVTSLSSHPNNLCLASLVKPLLQILALPKSDSTPSLSKQQIVARDAAGQLLIDVQHKLASRSTESKHQIVTPALRISCTGYRSILIWDLCQIFTESCISKHQFPEDSVKCWLDNVSATLHQQEACSSQLTNLVSAILVTSRSEPVIKASVNVIVKIAQTDQKQAPDFLPLILYTLGQIHNPESRLVLLESMPLLATHKFCVAPILKIIQALGKSVELKAVSIRLLLLLWQQQDRCFPQLLQAVSEPHREGLHVKDDSPPDDVLLAKAAAILAICKHKPELHGADLLAPLSDILSVASGEKNTAASVLALEGLILLCQAEVIDLQSLWSVLGEKLKHETRPLVITRICLLLALVPDLMDESEGYQTFTREAVSSLWLYSESSNVVVSSAALSALAKFSPGHFCVSHLPRKVTEELYYQAEMAAMQQQAQAKSAEPVTIDVDQMFPQVPGYCYILLLKQQMIVEKIAACQKFIEAILIKEVRELPRGVFYCSLRRQGLSANQGKLIETIPKFLLQQYDKCKQPGLLPGLAAGLLFCYDPPMEVGRDGRPRKHYVVRHGKTFLQTFTALLQEVPVQPSEWHRSALMPQSWNSFMERLFISMLESRRAELEQQEQQGQTSVTEFEEKKSLAWLVVRDSILDVIKSASMGTPAVQANCVLALAGLALCVHRFATDLDSSVIEAADHSSEHMGHSHWLTVTSDTIFSLIDIEYKPKSGLHGLCQQKSTLDRSPASTLCCGMARLAASQLVPVFIARDTDRILHLLTSFTSALPNRDKALESPLLVFCNGLAIGMLLGRLFEEHYSEMTGSKGMLAVWKSLTALEDTCLTSDAENRTGCVLGLGMALCGMCSEGKTEFRVHITTMLEKMQNMWMELPVNDQIYESLCVAVTSITGSLYASNASSEETVLPIVERLHQLHQQNPQITGICLALGLLTFSLNKLGLRSVSQLRQELVQRWLQDCTKQSTPVVEKVSKLAGLLSLIGSEQTLIPVQGSSMSTGSDVNVSEVITAVTQIIVDHSELGLQSIGAWMLGHLHLSACAVAENRSNVPSNYGHLPDSSILRAVVDFLLEAGRLGPESLSTSIVAAALQSLKIKAPLPPVNWAGIFSPFMRLNYGEPVKALSLQIGASQMASSPSAAMFVSSWLTPPLYTTLQKETQATLHRCMPEIIKTTAPSVLKMYFERSCLPAFIHGNDSALQLSVLKGLRDALALDDPPASVTMLLHELTGQIYEGLPNSFNIPILHALAECFAQVPDDVMDSIIVADFADATTQVKGSFVRCHLVATGKQPLSLLNYMIDASFNTDYWEHSIGMLLLTHCLAAISKSRRESSELQLCQQWLLELLGHTCSIVTGAMPLAETAPAMKKVTRVVINVVTCTMLTLTYPANTDLDLLGLDPGLFVSEASRSDARSPGPKEVTPKTALTASLKTMYANIAEHLPLAVGVLFRKPWDVVIPKMFDWLMTLLQLSETSSKDRHILHAALMALKHGQEMKQASVWTKAVLLDY